jgi:hypothetical protein
MPRTLTDAEQNVMVSQWLKFASAYSPADCYSDHDHDIDTKGSCDYCHGTTKASA